MKFKEYDFSKLSNDDINTFYNLSSDVKEVSRIKNGVFKVKINEVSYLFKLSRHIYLNKNDFLLGYVKQKVFEKQFKKEKLINKILIDNYERIDIKFPKLIYGDSGIHIFEYIEGSINYDPSLDTHQEEMINIIKYLNFELILLLPQQSIIKNYLIETIKYTKYILYGIKNNFSFKYRLKLFAKYLKLRRNHLISHFDTGSHGDLQVNVIESEDGLYVIDYETYGNSNYLLEDLVLSVFNISKSQLNIEMFNYIVSSEMYTKKIVNKDWLENEVRILLIRTCVRVLSSTTTGDELKGKLVTLLNDTLYEKENYKEWYSDMWVNKS